MSATGMSCLPDIRVFKRLGSCYKGRGFSCGEARIQAVRGGKVRFLKEDCGHPE